MSYDLQIWSIEPVSVPIEMIQRDGWQSDPHGWDLGSRNWQITVERSGKILPEDLPEAIAHTLPGIQYLSEINLEPLSAPDDAKKKLLRAARRLANTAHGVVLDKQTDEIITPQGVKRYAAPKQSEPLDLLQMSWWFVPGQHSHRRSLEAFVGLLKVHLPEALPRRYGPVEPPEHLLEVSGKEHFLSFLENQIDGLVVWYPHKPVLNIALALNKDWGASPLGYRANYLQISIDTSALGQPGWETTLRRFWEQSSVLLAPFYGDVRLLHNYARGRGTYHAQAASEDHPVYGPWWTGIPTSLGQAAVVGKPYISLWPNLSQHIQIKDDLAFVSLEDWSNPGDASRLVGGVPQDLSQPRTGSPVSSKQVWGQALTRRRHYPKTWPFEGPYSDK